MGKNTILKLENIIKTFSSVKALDNVHLDIEEGEVHALCGENGAGKSTLMKIIAGAQPYTSGKMYMNGKEVKFHSTKEAEREGIAMIYQEFNMIADMSIAENMYLGRFPKTKVGTVNWNELNKNAEKMLQYIGLKGSPKDKVRHLTVAEAQMVEIAKCLTIGAKVIIMDEPTAALTKEEIRILFGIIEELKKKGISIIYISHRMDEIFQISDRLTVLRDGKYINTKKIEDTNYDEVVSMMVGKDIGDLYPKRNYVLQEVSFEVKNLCGKGVENVSFQLHKGEILGITGLLGSGTIQLSKIIYGALPKESGEILINRQLVHTSSPRKSLNCGIGFVSDDRKQEGLILNRNIAENISISSLKSINRGLFISRRLEKKKIDAAIKRLNIKCSSEQQQAGKLSGGNQQKVVFAKVTDTNPDICILDEPTRGVDVGAKAEIYEIINKMANEGKSIIIISTDLPEVVGMCDRVIVMREGKKVIEVSKAEISQENLLSYASGGINE